MVPTRPAATAPAPGTGPAPGPGTLRSPRVMTMGAGGGPVRLRMPDAAAVGIMDPGGWATVQTPVSVTGRVPIRGRHPVVPKPGCGLPTLRPVQRAERHHHPWHSPAHGPRWCHPRNHEGSIRESDGVVGRRMERPVTRHGVPVIPGTLPTHMSAHVHIRLRDHPPRTDGWGWGPSPSRPSRRRG